MQWRRSLEQREAPRRRFLLLGGEHRVAVPEALGVVHRQVGAAQEIVDVVAVLGRQGDADARVHLDRHGRRPRRARSSACSSFQATLAAPARSVPAEQQDPELVATEPRDGVSVAEAADEAVGDELEQHVAVLVAERVVDVLEVVEVEEQQRQRLVRPQRRRGSRGRRDRRTGRGWGGR